MNHQLRLAIVGGGNMGSAIAAGATAAGFLGSGELIVCEPDPAKHAALSRTGARITSLHAEALAALDDGPGRGSVLLAVKPQSLDELARQVRGLIPPSCAIISILAGTPVSRLAAALGRESLGGIIRAMPNTAVAARCGVTALCPGPGVSSTQRDFAERLFSSLGDVVTIDESLMDAFTALAGSGPAYLYYLAEAMALAATEIGFKPALADRIVRRTIRGASVLLAETNPGTPPGELRAAVTSKGGTTEAAVETLDDRRVMRAIADAIVRARDRGRELGQRR